MTDQPYMPVKAKSAEWQTPRALFDALDKEFGPFNLDPAALPGQYTAETIIAHGGVAFCPPGTAVDVDSPWLHDGLLQPWTGRVFLNPPYDSKSLYTWCQKATSELALGLTQLVCAVLPVKSEQPWWQEFVVEQVGQNMRYANNAHYTIGVVRFLPKRQRYVGAGDAGATFPSAVVVWEA